MLAASNHAIASGTAHLWRIDVDAFADRSTTSRWLARLSRTERVRYSAIRTSAARRGYLATRALARIALACYSGQPAERVRFGADRSGRPEIDSPRVPGLSFSLSNTRELAVGLF